MKAETKVAVVRPKKPRILVVGGEPRNMQSKKLHEQFEITHVDRTYRTIPALRDKEFDGVALLPWKDPKMIKAAKAWADGRNIHCVEVRSIGQMSYYLGQKITWIKKYIEEFEKKETSSGKLPEQKTAAPAAPVPTPTTKTTVQKVDEDDLWDKYGEKLVQDYIRGLDGTETKRDDFMKYLREAVGRIREELGEPNDATFEDDGAIELLIGVMRVQGVISERGPRIIIGKRIEKIDLEKRGEFIKHGGATPSVNHGPSGIQHEVRSALVEEEKKGKPVLPVLKKSAAPAAPVDVDALYSSKKPGSTSSSKSDVLDDKILGFYKSVAGKVFLDQGALFRELFKMGLRKDDGKPFSAGAMRNYLARATKMGVTFPKVKGWSFTVQAPIAVEDEKPQAAPTPSIQIPEEVVKSVEAEAPVPAPTAPAPQPAPASPVSLKEYFSKPGKIYDAICASYPTKKIPDLAGLEEVARVTRSLFWPPAWDKSAARTVLGRLKLPMTEENLSLVQNARQDFTDEEWSYFAIEYLRDQPLGSLFTMFSREDGIYRKCEDCGDDFFVRFLNRCRGCFEKRKNFINDAKRGGDA